MGLIDLNFLTHLRSSKISKLNLILLILPSIFLVLSRRDTVSRHNAFRSLDDFQRDEVNHEVGSESLDSIDCVHNVEPTQELKHVIALRSGWLRHSIPNRFLVKNQVVNSVWCTSRYGNIRRHEDGKSKNLSPCSSNNRSRSFTSVGVQSELINV